MRILLVDDDEILVDVLQKTLGEKNYIFDAVLDGEQGWTYGSTYSYDLMILDWSMPKLDGITLCKRFRAYGYQIPILLLTAHHSNQEKIIGLDAGADDYLCKPFNVEELRARIRALLRRSCSNALPILSWGDLHLDTRSCQVTHKEELLSLTGKEYQLLKLFLSHRQEVFSIEEIMENLWSSLEYPSEATVRSHLRHLRQKLKQAGLSDDPIETLRGRGYCLKREPQQHKYANDSDTHFYLKQYSCPLPEILQKQEQHLTALTQAWQKYRHQYDQQLETLHSALQAWQDDGYISREQREKARSVAHKLAGTIGIFGLNEGSRLARELELLLQEVGDQKQPLSQFHSIFHALQKELSGEEDLSAQFSEQLTEHFPLLLVIDNDRQFSDLLRQQAIAANIQTVSFTNIPSARNWFSQLAPQQIPHVVLLRLSLSESTEQFSGLEVYLSVIKELKSLNPSISIIIITDRDRFEDRLLLVNQGATFVLKQPVTAQQAIAFCQKALTYWRKEQKVMILDDDQQLLRSLPLQLKPWDFTLTTLDDPRQFWDVLQAVSPNLLILTSELPYLSSIDICQVIRAHPSWHALPIICLKNFSTQQVNLPGLTDKVDEFLEKPIVVEHLAKRILFHLEQNLHRGFSRT